MRNVVSTGNDIFSLQLLKKNFLSGFGFSSSGVTFNHLAVEMSPEKFLFLSLCECEANKLHTTLWALDLVAFLVWAVFLLWFVCGQMDCSTQST
jgi:hypothetical protein